jgi:molybdopterin converting factor small subunit
MKKRALIFLFIPIFAMAENPQQMSQQQMQNMMGQQDMQQMMIKMQQMEACMKEVDQKELEALSQQGNLLEQSSRKLCQEGKRAEAQKGLVGFANNVNNNDELKKMRACLAKIDLPMMKNKLDDKFHIDTSKNICDLIKH